LIEDNIIDNPAGYQISKDVDGAAGLTVTRNLCWPVPIRLNNLTDISPVTGDPLFVNPGAGDFHIQHGSAAIGSGIVLADVPQDKDGVQTPAGTGADIGAYEHTPRFKTASWFIGN
jgi:hypothetical protein